ncbi:MAG TPA: VPDSG-CTERM sorting domain-containing protein [Verrucomicrobiae bacterium]
MSRFWVALAAAAAIPASSFGITVLTENFETPGNFIGPGWYRYVQGNDIPGWTVLHDGDGERAYLMDDKRYVGTSIDFFDKQALMLNEGSGIQRTISLVAGETYQVSLWGYTNGKGAYGVEVSLGGVLETLFFDHFNTGLTERTFTFTAAQTGDTLLKIWNPDDPTADYKCRAIDNLSIVSVPDGGASLMLFGLGLGSLFCVRRFLPSRR